MTAVPRIESVFGKGEIAEMRARFAEEAAARAAQVQTTASRTLLARSRTVIDKDRYVLTVVDGDVLDDAKAIEAEAAEQEHRRLARLGAERTTPGKQAAALRKYNPEIVAVIEAEAAAAAEQRLRDSAEPAGVGVERLARAAQALVDATDDPRIWAVLMDDGTLGVRVFVPDDILDQMRDARNALRTAALLPTQASDSKETT